MPVVRFSLFFLLSIIQFSAGCTGQNSQSPALPAHQQLGPVPVSNNPDSVQISQYITSMLQDRNGNIWFGTNGDGVCRYNASGLRYYTTGDGLPANTVRHIMEEENGTIWFATTNGVSRYDGNTFSNYGTADGLSHKEVWYAYKDRSGTIWFGTDGGVTRYDGKRFSHFMMPIPDHSDATREVYPASAMVRSILQDRAGNIWIGTNGGGIYRYDGKQLHNLSTRDGLCNNYVMCMLEDRNGLLWVGTLLGGVCQYNGKSIQTIAAVDGYTHHCAWTMMEDKAGRLWIGSAGGGLFCYQAGRFSHYTQAEGVANRHVQSLLQDSNGTIWAGTSGGVLRMTGNRFAAFTRKDAGQ